MALEEYGRYQTVSSNCKVIMKGPYPHEEMIFRYGFEILQILGISNKSYEEQEEILKEHQVLCGMTDHPILTSGHRHDKTGKCLGGNAGGVMGRGDELRKRLANFDIKIEE